jgi:hypothetical protein
MANIKPCGACKHVLPPNADKRPWDCGHADNLGTDEDDNTGFLQTCEELNPDGQCINFEKR